MKRIIDMTGQQYGKWLVLNIGTKRHPTHWLCRCECGTIRDIPRGNLIRGMTTNCGCEQRKKNKDRMSTHGESKTKLYGVWLAMRRRCYLPTDKGFKNWGGRGIKVCEEWRNDYQSFNEWSLSNGYKEGLTIERIDNDKDYSPDNCKWATRLEQGGNTRRVLHIEIDGLTRTVKEWSEISGISGKLIRGRIKKGWIGSDLLLPTWKGNKHHAGRRYIETR